MAVSRAFSTVTFLFADSSSMAFLIDSDFNKEANNACRLGNCGPVITLR